RKRLDWPPVSQFRVSDLPGVRQVIPPFSRRTSSMKRLLCGVVAWGLLVGLTGPAKAQYDFTTIDVPGAISTGATGINDAGQIVGLYVGTDRDHGFLLSGGSYTTLDVPGADHTYASGINDSGQIVGRYIVGGTGHGFLLDVDGNYYPIDIPGAVHTGA